MMDFQNFQPCFLIAMPELQDSVFEKSVVLLTDYSEDGASGFIVNKKSKHTLGEALILEDGEIHPNYESMSLWIGGPVEAQHAWILYDNTMVQVEENAIELGDKIALAKTTRLLTDTSKTYNTNFFKVIHGCAGWDAEQIQSEIANSFWLTSPVDATLIFDTPPDKIWSEAIKKLGFEPEKLVGPSSPFLN